MNGVEFLKILNKIGVNYGIGIVDIVENRFVGMKLCGVYEILGGIIFYYVYRELEYFCFDRVILYFKDMVVIRFVEFVYDGFWFLLLREVFLVFVDKI